MDLKLHRPRGTCAVTGRSFAPGEPFYSALIRRGGDLDRLDVAPEAWTGPPERALAWWRSIHATAEAAGPELAPVDVLLDVLEELDGDDDAPLRYLLALQLVRRRVLRVVDDPGGAANAGYLVVACRRRDREYRVREVPPAAAETAAVEQRLVALLWSGGAA